MGAVLAGTLLQRTLSRRFSAVQLLTLSAALALVSLCLVVTLTYPAEATLIKYKVLLVVFCTFELSVGLYYPSMRRLQKEVMFLVLILVVR